MQVIISQIDNGLETIAFQESDINSRSFDNFGFIISNTSAKRRNKSLDSDTFDYAQHDYIKTSDGSRLNDGVCFSLQTQTGLLAIVHIHMKVEDERSLSGKHSTNDPSENHIFVK